MEGTSMRSPDLPPGFRFHPTDEELITYYLKPKVLSSSSNPIVSLITDIDLYKFNPWDLPGKALFGQEEWFFFSPRDRKYPNGDRPNRVAGCGYWKATGTDKPILSSCSSMCLGVKKALVFYKGKPSKGLKTDWVMDEYRLLDDVARSPRVKGSMRLDDWVLCRVRRKFTPTSQMRDHKHENSLNSGSSPPMLLQDHYKLEDQARKKRDHEMLFEGCHDNQLLTYLGSPDQSTAGTSSTNYGMYRDTSIITDHHQEITPKFSEVMMMADHDHDNMAQTNMVNSSFQTMLESIKRTLSIGALDELHASSVVPPLKRQASSDYHAKIDDDQFSP
ncbi:hypothetical protein Scep_028185 [Stephania cephalantha]|uniref:NAC domain-containing protein n=1 Tax=Stephania cephalantha TaxID=152367 RepID=A0AAP0ED69_9MAGN